MKELSPDRQSYLTRLIVDELLKSQAVSDSSSGDMVFKAVKKALSLFVTEWREVDQLAQKKISGIKRNVVPGSSEWEVLYSQYIEELFQKKSFLFVKDN
ncbi:MAG: DUF507 family protein [Bdellovibrionales bacterium]|nr:DUF507 family protein [Bdellovibrionales bacterium]